LNGAAVTSYAGGQMMKRPASKRTFPKHGTPPGAAAKAGHALVRVDGTAARNKIKRDYEKAKRDLDSTRRQLDQFQQADLPQFTQWLNSHFGALLTELRELSQKLAVDEALVFAVENEVFFGGGSHARAYKRVIEARDNPSPPPPPGEDDPADRDQGPFGARPEFEEFEEFEGGEDPLEAFFNAMFGESGPGEGARHKKGPPGGPRPEPARHTAAATRLKELYRALVRRLHPDSQQEMTAQKTEWWHQAQAAYEAGDADQLEVILTLCEIGESGTTVHTSASLLQRITAQMRSSLREIRRQVAERRRDPAWGFSRRADREVLALQTRRTLMSDLQELRERWQETQDMIAGWKAAAERVKPGHQRKARTGNMEFPF
jgi:hypothetical protein